MQGLEKGGGTEVLLYRSKVTARYTNEVQSPAKKPNSGPLFVIAGLDNEVATDFCLAPFYWSCRRYKRSTT